jgi:hypothetical protein
MAFLHVDRATTTGAFAVDWFVEFSGEGDFRNGNLSIVARASGKYWKLNHVIVFCEDPYQVDGVPEWVYERGYDLVQNIMRRKTIDTEHWMEVTAPVYMTSRQPS